MLPQMTDVPTPLVPGLTRATNCLGGDMIALDARLVIGAE